ncbi:phytanoyl-CoA dioxygenase family protein [Aureivirga marina]|uniref:phytanoyl-CoA dioxygenase family protein n=1 Tax=Aureivirga marina TaxID=1182451 RepID=UPI0018C93018|nr:phytanoyl-CoA dioxygenase family protein [Aureivirga marina]
MSLRSYKFTYQLYNFFKKDQLKHNIPFYKKYNLNKKYYSSISSEDFIGIDSPPNLYDVKDSKEELPKKKTFQTLDDKTQNELLSWSDDGYVVLENFFSEEEIESYKQEIDDLLESGKVKFRYGNKIMFAIHHSKTLRSAGNNKKLLQILSLLMDKNVELFQSINFIEGSQQRTHSDSIHMTTFPYGNLIAVWVALEDIKPDSGPLHYYPKSHKLPYIHNRDYDNVGTKYKIGDKLYNKYEDCIEDVLRKTDLEKKIFLPKKGDLLIWHANLLHGGEKVTNENSTRKSMVFHYYTDDAICFHEISQRPTLKNKKLIVKD